MANKQQNPLQYGIKYAAEIQKLFFRWENPLWVRRLRVLTSINFISPWETF